MAKASRKLRRVWYFRYVDAEGVKCERRGCPDKKATEEMARDAENHAAKVRSGLVDPRDLAIRDADRRPLADHLIDWRAAMLAKGRTAKHGELVAQPRLGSRGPSPGPIACPGSARRRSRPPSRPWGTAGRASSPSTTTAPPSAPS